MTKTPPTTTFRRLLPEFRYAPHHRSFPRFRWCGAIFDEPFLFDAVHDRYYNTTFLRALSGFIWSINISLKSNIFRINIASVEAFVSFMRDCNFPLKSDIFHNNITFLHAIIGLIRTSFHISTTFLNASSLALFRLLLQHGIFEYHMVHLSAESHVSLTRRRFHPGAYRLLQRQYQVRCRHHFRIECPAGAATEHFRQQHQVLLLRLAGVASCVLKDRRTQTYLDAACTNMHVFELTEAFHYCYVFGHMSWFLMFRRLKPFPIFGFAPAIFFIYGFALQEKGFQRQHKRASIIIITSTITIRTITITTTVTTTTTTNTSITTTTTTTTTTIITITVTIMITRASTPNSYC